ncbi:hypothetical protein Tco_1547186 [Tanacetum coccineum]
MKELSLEEHNVQEEINTSFLIYAEQDAAVTPIWKEKKEYGFGDNSKYLLDKVLLPKYLNFEDEAGPSSPLRPIQGMDSEEQHNAAEVLVSISRPRGTDPKDKGKGILVEEPKKKLTFQQIRALETTNDEEVARKIQAEWDAEKERKRFEELKKTKQRLL